MKYTMTLLLIVSLSVWTATPQPAAAGHCGVDADGGTEISQLLVNYCHPCAAGTIVISDGDGDGTLTLCLGRVP